MSFLTVSLPDGSTGSGTRGPRIGYENVGAGATVTATSTAAGFDPANLFDWKPYTYWQAAAGGTQRVTVTPATTPTVDYFAVAQHNLGTNGGTIQLQYSLDGGTNWLNAFAAIAPVGTETLWRTFAPITASLWRIEVTGATPSVIAVVSFGRAYQPGRGMVSGFMPTILARESEIYSTSSEAGLFLGRSILRRHTKNTLTIEHMNLTEAYNYWQPFMKHAEKKPFFFSWLQEDWPLDVALVESDGELPSPSFSRPFALTASIKMRGLLAS